MRPISRPRGRRIMVVGALALTDQQMWAVYGLAAFTIVYIVLRPILRRRKDPLANLPALSLSQQRGVEREMSNLLVELSNMARQVSAQLDTRSAKLEALIAEADRKIAELKRLSAAADSGDATRDTISPPAPSSPHEIEQRYAEVYALSDAGRSASEIAAQLNRPQGEIELILALRIRV